MGWCFMQQAQHPVLHSLWCWGGAAGAAAGAAAAALRGVLDAQDEVLGPWVPGEDPLEDALASFAGECHHVWPR
jgi:hypothetical protein